MTSQQVLIFDSGVGGLSIFQKILKQNPSVTYHYLFDNTYFPYGELEELFLIDRLTSLLLAFLESQHIDLIVIACNTASTIALNNLRKLISVPIIGVVPAIKPAASITKNNVIGLLATPATINRAYTQELIDKFAKNASVVKIGSTKLVQLAELKLQGANIEHEEVKEILKSWLELEIQPDTIVLGCTHFPLLKNEISKCFPNDIRLVDSGDAIAKRVSDLLPISNYDIRPYNSRGFYTLTQEPEKLEALEIRFNQFGISSLTYLDLKNINS